jgi:hypothetical protein
METFVAAHERLYERVVRDQATAAH